MDIIERYLSELRDAFCALSRDTGTRHLTYHSTPLILILTAITAVTQSYAVLIASLLMAIALLILSYIDSPSPSLAHLLRPVVTMLILVIVITLPIAIGVVESCTDIALFMARTLISTTLLICGIQAVGWINVVRGMELLHIPKPIVESMVMMLRFLSLFIDEVLSMLIARSARLIGRPRGVCIWRMLASIVSDIVLKSLHRAYAVSIARSARTLGHSSRGAYRRARATVLDRVLIIYTAMLIALDVVNRLWGGI